MTPTRAVALVTSAVPLLAVGAATCLLSPLGALFVAAGSGLVVAAALDRLSAWLVEEHPGTGARHHASEVAPTVRPLDHLLGFEWYW